MMRTHRDKKLEANYLSYLDLDLDDTRLFIAGGLGNYIALADKQLSTNKTIRDWNNYSELRKTLTQKNKLNILSAHIEYVLCLIGKHANTRFGNTAQQQHAFFQRPGEQENFFTYLFMASQMEKLAILAKKRRKIKSELPVPFLGNIHWDLNAHENKDTFKYAAEGISLTERQLYAIGIFYMMNFIFDALKQDDALRLMRLINNMHHFQSGPSYRAAHGKRGGKKTAAQRNSKKEQGYQIFLNCKIHDMYGPKTAAMLSALMPQLRRRKIKISDRTVETKWIPEYLKRLQPTD